MSLVLNELKAVALSFKFKTLSSNIHHKWKEIIDFVCKIIRDQRPKKSSIELEDKSLS